MVSRRSSASHLAQVILEMVVAEYDQVLSDSLPERYVDNVEVVRLNFGLR